MHFKVRIYSTLLILTLQLLHLCNGDVEARIDELEAQVKELKEEIGALDDLEKVVKRNIADQKLDKTVASILLNEQEKAAVYWKEVLQFLDPSLEPIYIKSLIEHSYLGNSDNFYSILNFLTLNKLFSGYAILYKDLEMHKEIRTGQEIFVLGHVIKSICGTNNQLYSSFPKVVKEILGGPVILKNVDNKGYITAGDQPYDCPANGGCYNLGGGVSSQVFVTHLRAPEIDGIQENAKAHWQFTAPTPLNISQLRHGFFMKNQNFFFVFYQRPPMGYLRSNLTFPAYYARDLHAQYEPALLPNSELDDNQIRIGIRERFLNKISYFLGKEFGKKMHPLDMSRIPYQNENMFHWEVIPVGSDTSDNYIEGGATKCNLTLI